MTTERHANTNKLSPRGNLPVFACLSVIAVSSPNLSKDNKLEETPLEETLLEETEYEDPGGTSQGNSSDETHQAAERNKAAVCVFEN